MADETPPRRPAGPEPASDAKKIKRVVLSSVAKVPENESESLLGEPEPSKDGPPTLPPKTDAGLIRPVGWTTRPGGTTTIIKLPPKTGVLPRMMSLSPQARETPPTVPPQAPPVAAEEEKRPTPIRIETPAAPTVSEQDSIFAPEAPAPVEAKPLAPPKRAVPPPLPPPTVHKAPALTEAKASTPPVQDKTEPHLVPHVPRLVAPDASAPETEPIRPPLPASIVPPADTPKFDPFAQTVKLSPAPPAPAPTIQPAQGVLPLPEAPKRVIPVVVPTAEAKAPDSSPNKHRLPPRAAATGRLRPAPEASPSPVVQRPAIIPPKIFPITPAVPAAAVEPAGLAPVKPAPPLSSTPQAIKSSVTPPTIPLQGSRDKTPIVPLRPAPAAAAAFAPISPLIRDKPAEDEEDDSEDEAPTAPAVARAIKKRRRRLAGIITFYVLLVILLPCLYEGALYFTQETRVEGQVIPPPGMLLGNEVWIVTDFRDLASGIADDLASARQIVVQDMQEKLGHVQRAQADVATREARIRLLKDQIQSDNDEEISLMKQARDASQQVWDGPGAQMEVDYQSRLNALNLAIATRARANKLAYNPDPSFFSPEVWANAYRLALYEVPAGVDAVKERSWLDAQMKAWHDFTKEMDAKENDFREQAAKLKLQPAARVADLKSQVTDLQQRIDATLAEEEPLKAELEQARTDLAAVQAKEQALDGKPYEMLDALPEKNVTKRLDLQRDGRFSWREVEKENKYTEGEKAHVFWIFARAFRADGRQYWALNRFSVAKDSTTLLLIEPDNFVSTKAILRPDLSPDEQAR
jgi:hypothetical protein